MPLPEAVFKSSIFESPWVSFFNRGVQLFWSLTPKCMEGHYDFNVTYISIHVYITSGKLQIEQVITYF